MNKKDNSSFVREMLQTRLLSAIFVEATKNELVLEGGMAFRTLLGSHRKTKDIDFGQSQEVPLERLQKIMGSAINKTLSTKILRNVSVSTPKQTDTVGRWKINGETGNGSHVNLTIEVSRRGLPPDEYIHSINYIPPNEFVTGPIMIDVYDVRALAAGKVSALMSPNRLAARDLYDMHLLIQMQIEPPVELLAFWDTEYLQEMMRHVWEKIDLFEIDQIKSELFPYIPENISSRITEEELVNMKIIVAENVEKWMKYAIEIKEGQQNKIRKNLAIKI